MEAGRDVGRSGAGDRRFRRQLAQTVARFNGFCETGIDADFHRGETPYDIYIANELPSLFGREAATKVGSPNPCLIPIRTGPFYAAKVGLGDLGSKGGLKTDAASRVLREDGSVIQGLYAAGDTMAAASGEHYPAPGTPIGSCMVFSYLAAMDMAAGECKHVVDLIRAMRRGGRVRTLGKKRLRGHPARR